MLCVLFRKSQGEGRRDQTLDVVDVVDSAAAPAVASEIAHLVRIRKRSTLQRYSLQCEPSWARNQPIFIETVVVRLSRGGA